MQYFLAAAICLLLTLSCSDLGDQGIGGTGTITYTGVEGGCWGIDLDHGGFYEIRDPYLDLAFKKPGLRVWIDARLIMGTVELLR